MFIQPECQELSFETAGLTWYLKNRPFFETATFLADHQGDLILSKIAAKVSGVSGGSSRHQLSPEQARLVISKLTAPQLMELDLKFKKAVTKFIKRDLSFVVPAPLGLPHWKQPLAAKDRLSSENRGLLDHAIQKAHHELRNPDLAKSRALSNFETVQRGLVKAKQEEADRQEDPTRAYGDLYPMSDQSSPSPLKHTQEVKERLFVLSDTLQLLWPIISSNLLTLHGTWAGNSVALRYVSKKEILALNQMVSTQSVRERLFCAMSIVSINDTWCLSSSTHVNPLALSVVDSWAEEDLSRFYDIFSGIRSFAESLMPYIEALPFTKLFRDFWDLNRGRDRWWQECYTGVPGTGTLPPSEHIDLFSQECLLDETAVGKIEADDTLSFQVAGMSHELAQGIQKKNTELVEARGLQINYMLFNEVPEIKETQEGVLALPGETSRDEIISVAQDMLQGKMDFHDTMLAVMRQRKEAMQTTSFAPPEPLPAPASDADAYEGGSHYATSQEIQEMHRASTAHRVAVDNITLAFSQDVVENIAKARKRSLLIQGVDPYHERDESEDLGRASLISRDKSYRE